jgi:predicted ferric reductase
LASFLIWGLDRLIRLVRLVVFNHSYFGFKKGSGTMDASVELLSPHFVRLRLRRPPHFHWSPGQTAYLIMPEVSTIPFEAHPFTIASVDTTHGEGDIFPITEEKGALGENEPHWKELVFFINVHGGFTKNLHDIAEKVGKVKVFVDGPYGKSPDLTDYDTSVLIAGGSGVSFTLPLLLDSIK